MGIFNNISKKSGLNIQSATISFDLVFSDYVKNDDLDNYYKKSEPLVMPNTIDMSGNRITSLGDPTEATDTINRRFLHKRITTATANIKTEFTTTLLELTKTNNDKVSEN